MPLRRAERTEAFVRHPALQRTASKSYALRCVRGTSDYAMNIRAADASVSRPPKAMKIFPISEVWSQVEFCCC